MYLSKKFAARSPRQKLLARITLYGGLTALLILVALGISYLGRPLRHGRDAIGDIAALRESEEVKLLQEYIRIDTSTDTGSELEGALFLAGVLEQAGLESHIERLGDKQANLWAVLEGETDEAIVLHNHIDVYSAGDVEHWDFPPFGGVIDKAWIYGRGAFDMKSLAIAQLMAFRELAKEGRKPKNSVIFLASGSEEIGSDLGSKWILTQQPALAKRFALVLTEGGVVETVSHDEVKYWGVEFAQKWFADGWACAETRQRLEQLREDLAQISDSNHKLRIEPEVQEFLVSYAQSRGAKETRQILSDLQRAMDHADEFNQLPAYLQSLFRDETAPFEVEPDPEGGGYRMRLILHLLPGSEFAEVHQRLLPDWATAGVSVTMEPPGGADHGSPTDLPYFQILLDSVKEVHPAANVGPYFLAWSATDARFFRQENIPAYGFSPFLIFVTDTFRRDTLNERIDLQGYVEGVDLYRQVVRRLAG